MVMDFLFILLFLFLGKKSPWCGFFRKSLFDNRQEVENNILFNYYSWKKKKKTLQCSSPSAADEVMIMNCL